MFKNKSFHKWKETTLKHVIMFEPCLKFNKWKGKARKWSGKTLNAEEAFYVWESTGLDPYDSCNDKDGFINLLDKKDNMNFQINEWKQELQMISKFSSSTFDNYLYSYIVIESIIKEFGLDFVKKINLVPIV